MLCATLLAGFLPVPLSAIMKSHRWLAAPPLPFEPKANAKQQQTGKEPALATSAASLSRSNHGKYERQTEGPSVSLG